MRLVFAGSPEVAAVSLAKILDEGKHEVLAVVTRPPARSGRGLARKPSPVGALAEERGVPVLAPTSAKDPQFQEALRELAPDCAPIVGYGALIPPALLAVPKHGWVNVHFSLLPAWRGAAPAQAAIAAGDEITGVSTFLLEEGLDTGPVFGQATERIRDTDTGGALLDRLAESGAQLLATTLAGIEAGALAPVPQAEDGASYASKISAADARVRWDLPSHVVDRRIRAMTPAPGAWTLLHDKRLKLGPLAKAQEAVSELGPGELRATKSAVYVGTGSEPLVLGEVRPEGKGPMRATDWARGARLEQGSCFA
ncbi:methionyl-tRNA formyltransferase [Segniliparus rugosus]|uniref:Methionyl-tRNA formyltransferase n=1 Tax=Segniliparus rugosus (strain ATCC BAA-974 / DSM 45345 / CCUG 50838 / CIP 108380 / JCM 13579 / CDC 945) TaxID=679197 RepID=E5XL32_SEGRC|nr:methionyl-tRNA formyltransferase [Segniliparus rugosus]EFV14900.1 methionyl-tRNA formyltransferase [Segniliparus rugosus ATCC BAA-974]